MHLWFKISQLKIYSLYNTSIYILLYILQLHFQAKELTKGDDSSVEQIVSVLNSKWEFFKGMFMLMYGKGTFLMSIQ